MVGSQRISHPGIQVDVTNPPPASSRSGNAGLPANDLLVPGQLDRLTQLHLRDAFRVLRSVLDELAYRLELVR